MRNLKKFLALVLAMMMALSLMVTANAAHSGTQYGDMDQVTPAFEEAVDVLTGMGVFSGDNGSFYPARNVTRAEVAALIYRLDTGDVTDAQANLYAKYGNFSDVREDAWYAGYVGYCANKGLIKGRPGNVYDPSGNVTGYEALAMILRAIGYDKNGEFTGPDWQVNVSSLSQNLGVLKNIESTQYGGTLYLAARRDVVAELLFQTDAYLPTVNYTAAFGYQQYGDNGGVISSVKNDTLGYKIFGLTSNVGVVVGNEITGETKGITKIGFSLDSWAGANVNAGGSNDNEVITGFNQGGQATWYTRIDDSMGIRGADKRSAYIYESDTTNNQPKNVTRAFKWDSDLTLFNHAVKVWYNNKSGNEYVTVGRLTDEEGNTIRDGATGRFSSNLTTFAVIDKVVNTSVISLWRDSDEDGADDNLAADLGTVTTVGPLGSAAMSGTDSRSNNWKAPKFQLRADGANYAAYFNYSFGPNFAASGNTWTNGNVLTANQDGSYGSAVNGTNHNDVTRVADSPVLRNNEADQYRLYLLISNTENSVLDVVIPLDMTMTRIAQTNNTTSPKTVGVLAGNEDIQNQVTTGNEYFGDSSDYINSQDNVGDILALLAQSNVYIVPEDEKAILDRPGTKVAAIEITGTAPGNVDQATHTWNRNGGGTDTYNHPDNDGTRKLWDGESTSVDTEDIGNAVAASGLRSTYYYQLTKNHYTTTAKVLSINPNDQTLTLEGGKILKQSVFAESTDANFTRNIEGVDKDSKYVTTTYEKVLVEGKTYTFTLDAENGNYIYWDLASDTAEFAYGTYIDFTTEVASSAFDYPMVYVNANGDAKQKNNITNVQDFHEVTGAGCTWSRPLPHASHNYNRPVSGDMSNAIYDAITLPKRDANVNVTGTGNNSGFVKGFYIGYALDAEKGTIKAIDAFDAADPDTYVNDSLNTGFYQATGNDFGQQIITIDKNDVTIGSERVNNADFNVDYFLTKTTKFVVVDGAGMANQEVKIYNGIDELREGHSAVYIDVTDETDVNDDPDSLYHTGSKYLWNMETEGCGNKKPWEMVYFKFVPSTYAQDYVHSAYEIDTVFIPKAALSWSEDEGNASLYFVGDTTQTNISSIGGNYTQFKMYDKDGKEQLMWVEGWVNDAGNTTPASIIDANGSDVFYKLVATSKKAVDGSTVYTIRNVDSGVIGKVYNGYNKANDPQLSASTDYLNVTNDGWAEFAATTTNQSAWIDEATTYGGTTVTANLYNVNGANVTNLYGSKYPGITDLATLCNAGSITDNERVQVSCVLNGDVTVTTIFVNFQTYQTERY